MLKKTNETKKLKDNIKKITEKKTKIKKENKL